VPTAGAVTLTDARDFAGETPPITGITRSAAETTTNASGEVLTNLNTSLILPRTATYDVEAWVSALHSNGGGWVLQATYGSFGAGTSPLQLSSSGQVAVSPVDGSIYVADTGNNRLLKLTNGVYASAITGLTGITGVALYDGGTTARQGIYVAFLSAGQSMLRKYALDMSTILWSLTSATYNNLTHLASDAAGAYCFATYARSGGNGIIRFLYSGSLSNRIDSGAGGSGDGQFNTPYGIAADATNLYVVDQANSRVQKLTQGGGAGTPPAYVAQWTIGAGARGAAIDAAGQVLVAEYGSNSVKRYSSVGVLVDTFSQATPDGIGVATGDVAWVSNAGSHNLAKWDEAAAGYGGLAIEIDGNLGSYITLGNLTAMLQNSHVRTATGPATITVKVYGKSTSGTATFRSVVLSARAVPRA
jgi:hypothetical protein